MNLTITKINEKEFEVKFANEVLKINEQSLDWNIQGINKFLINLALKTPDDSKIEIIYDEKEEDKIYKHIYLLFKNFCDEYNAKSENN